MSVRLIHESFVPFSSFTVCISRHHFTFTDALIQLFCLVMFHCSNHVYVFSVHFFLLNPFLNVI